MLKIDGVEALTAERLIEEVRQGGRFKTYSYCVSILVMTFRRPSGIKYVGPYRSKYAAGLPFALTSMFLGWWGIPWGPIYTIASLVNFAQGGKDVTEAILLEAENVFHGEFATPEQIRELHCLAAEL